MDPRRSATGLGPVARSMALESLDAHDNEYRGVPLRRRWIGEDIGPVACLLLVPKLSSNA